MNYEFDFNIDNYSIDELQNFLKLNNSYSFNDINERCSKMYLIINESKEYDKIYKTRIGRFLDEVKLKLVKNIKDIAENDDGFIEDYDKLLIPHDEDIVINQTSVTGGNKAVMIQETSSLNKIIDPHKRFEPMESFPTLIARGHLNQLRRKAIQQTIIINTLFREDYYNTCSTDFTVILPYYFKNVLSLRLSSVQLPNVIYNVSKLSNNNTFYIREYDTDLSANIIFPEGSYNNISTFTSLLQTEINQQLGISPERFVVSYDHNSNKITISNIMYDFTLIFNKPAPTIYGKYGNFKPTDGQREQKCVEIEEIYKRFGWLCGYRKGEYANNNSYTTEGIFNAIYPNYVYFVLNDFNNSQAQNVFGMYSKSIIGNNILGMLPLTAPEYSINFTTGNDLIERRREYFGPVRIQRLKIELVNQYGDIINLNNMDFSFSLELEIAYDI